MGAYSELDIEQRYGTGAFAEDDDIPVFPEENTPPAVVEPAPVEPAVVPADIKAAAPQDVTLTAPAQADSVTKAEPQSTPDEVKSAKSEDEDAKRKAHEEAEAQRKAEFDARQVEKKAAEQAQIAALEAMSDDEVMAASMKRVSADTEKVTRRNMKECVAEYIQTMCIEDPAFARLTMHPRKSMIRCFQYINQKAWEYIQDELKANGIKPGPGQDGYGSDVPDDLCYQWALDYFNDPDIKIDHEDDEEFVPKPYYGGSTAKTKSGAKGKGKDKAADKKGAASKKAEDKKTAQKPADDTAQFSLDGFTMPEVKAG